MKINYARYHFSLWEIILCVMRAVGICILINYICYQNIWAFVPMVPFIIYYIRLEKKNKIRKRKELLRDQFKVAVGSLKTALSAGYSMENAIGEGIKDLQRLYSKEDGIICEFLYMQKQMGVSVPVEQLFQELGNRSGVEDIQSFASVYGIAKRSGGNLSRILQKTAGILEEKMQTRMEITAAIAAKKMEQQIMSVIPCGIILYMRFTSPGFLDVLYGNGVGVVVMTTCLIGYGIAYQAGKKIVDIEV